MTERDSDIEFDFFDEPETQETTQRRRLGRERGPRGPRGPDRPPRRPIRAPTGLTPLVRLVLLVAFAIFVVVLLVFWVQSCRGASKHNEYADYMNDVRAIASGSAGVGKSLNDALTTPGIKLTELQTRLKGLAQQESQYADQAQRIDPPGPLRTEHQHLVEVLQLRASGVSRLADAFRQTARSTNAANAARLLAAQTQLLAASDVNWDFYFRAPATRELRRQGVTGVAVPDSNVLQNPELASAQSLIPVFQRVHGGTTTGPRTGVHGVGLVSVRATPGDQQLSESSETKIVASTDLAFVVAVKNTGEGQEVRVPVRLTIQKTPAPIVKRGRIDVIDVGVTKTITFRITEQPPFGTPTRVKVEAGPVPSERTLTNNSAEYPVVFSLG
jgi:hypothetical protein